MKYCDIINVLQGKCFFNKVFGLFQTCINWSIRVGVCGFVSKQGLEDACFITYSLPLSSLAGKSFISLLLGFYWKQFRKEWTMLFYGIGTQAG